MVHICLLGVGMNIHGTSTWFDHQVSPSSRGGDYHLALHVDCPIRFILSILNVNGHVDTSLGRVHTNLKQVNKASTFY